MDFSGTIVEHLSYHTFSLAPTIAQEVQFYDMSPKLKKHFYWRNQTEALVGLNAVSYCHQVTSPI